MFEQPVRAPRRCSRALPARDAAPRRRSNTSAGSSGRPSRQPNDPRGSPIRGAPVAPGAPAHARRRCRCSLPTDLAALKPHVIVRTPEAFRLRLMMAALWLVAAFWAAHAFRRLRGTIGDPVAAAGRSAAVRDRSHEPCRRSAIRCATRCPSRPRSPASSPGSALLVLASEVDLEASPLRRAVLGPTRRRRRARIVAAALRHGTGNERRPAAAARVPARRLHPAARGVRARRALRAARGVPSRVLAGAHGVAPLAAPRERAPVEGRRARHRERCASSWRSSSCSAISVRRWCSRASSWACTAWPVTAACSSRVASASSCARSAAAYWTGIPGHGPPARRDLGRIPGATASPAATRSRTGCGRWRPARPGAAGLGAGSGGRRAGGRHRLHHDDCRRRARVRRARGARGAVRRPVLALRSRTAVRAPGDYTRAASRSASRSRSSCRPA